MRAFLVRDHARSSAVRSTGLSTGWNLPFIDGSMVEEHFQAATTVSDKQPWKRETWVLSDSVW